MARHLYWLSGEEWAAIERHLSRGAQRRVQGG